MNNSFSLFFVARAALSLEMLRYVLVHGSLHHLHVFFLNLLDDGLELLRSGHDVDLSALALLRYHLRLLFEKVERPTTTFYKEQDVKRKILREMKGSACKRSSQASLTSMA